MESGDTLFSRVLGEDLKKEFGNGKSISSNCQATNMASQDSTVFQDPTLYELWCRYKYGDAGMVWDFFYDGVTHPLKWMDDNYIALAYPEDGILMNSLCNRFTHADAPISISEDSGNVSIEEDSQEVIILEAPSTPAKVWIEYNWGPMGENCEGCRRVNGVPVCYWEWL